MSYLVRRFIIFLVALGVLFGAVTITFRCGYRQGLEDAPRHYYSVDVARSIRENSDFKRYVDSLYVSTYISVMDSVIRTDKVLGLVMNWLDSHPGCAMEKKSPAPVRKKEIEDFFFQKNR